MSGQLVLCPCARLVISQWKRSNRVTTLLLPSPTPNVGEPLGQQRLVICRYARSVIDCRMSRFDLPTDLPRPVDDGACAHLTDFRIPSVKLPATNGGSVDLSQLPGRTIVFCYPRTGRPNEPVPQEWDAIPGARGCTPQVCSFRDSYQALIEAGADQIFGLSTQDTDYQKEVAERLHLPYPLLSDNMFLLGRALRFPTFDFADMTLIKRLTLIIDKGVITNVFYPVFPPDESANETLRWLKEHPVTAT
jgi:peroxiredoxin